MIASLVVIATGVMLTVAVLLATLRMIKGPSAVDRAVAQEVFVATLVCALGIEAALNRHNTTVPILVSLSLVGFLCSVAVARFVAKDRDGTQIGGDPSAGGIR
ncbi:MAG: monovalent cation/H+ antiporter complex subunit F [Mobilicoccus sp.]|nr:monovalent cation/H+ antiporter complex subunit F [Mobilicoccus sp.]